MRTASRRSPTWTTARLRRSPHILVRPGYILASARPGRTFTFPRADTQPNILGADVAVSKTRKNARKTAKLYRMVTFTNDLFDDDFTFPDFSQLSIGTIEALNNGDI